MRAAITGGTGCMGKPLIEKLITRGFKLNVLALPEDARRASLSSDINVVTGSLNSDESLDALTKGCELVFHLAGKVHSIPKSRKEQKAFYDINLHGTELLIHAAKQNGVKRIVFYSTVAVYGDTLQSVGDESLTRLGISAYAKSKALAEDLVLRSNKSGGPEGVVLRFPVAYGPYDRGNIASLIKAVYRRFFVYFGDGGAVRSMISSANAAEGAIRAALIPGAANEVFCITDDCDYRVTDLVECICKALGTSWRPLHLPLAAAQLVGKIGDAVEKLTGYGFPIDSSKVRKLTQGQTFCCDKAKKLLSYEPFETLEQGISGEVSWLAETEGWD